MGWAARRQQRTWRRQDTAFPAHTRWERRSVQSVHSRSRAMWRWACAAKETNDLPLSTSPTSVLSCRQDSIARLPVKRPALCTQLTPWRFLSSTYKKYSNSSVRSGGLWSVLEPCTPAFTSAMLHGDRVSTVTQRKALGRTLCAPK